MTFQASKHCKRTYELSRFLLLEANIHMFFFKLLLHLLNTYMKSSNRDLWSVRVRHSWRTLSFSPVSVPDPESTDWGTTSVLTLLSAGMLALVTFGSFWTLAVSTVAVVLSEFSTLTGSANVLSVVNPSACFSDEWSSELISMASSFFTNSPHCMLPTNEQTCCIYRSQLSTVKLIQYTIRQPGFALPRQQWSLLNRFHTGQGHCSACKKKWKLSDSDQCYCGDTQTVSHIVESCPQTRLHGGLSKLHSADDDAIAWLTSYGS